MKKKLLTLMLTGALALASVQVGLVGNVTTVKAEDKVIDKITASIETPMVCPIVLAPADAVRVPYEEVTEEDMPEALNFLEPYNGCERTIAYQEGGYLYLAMQYEAPCKGYGVFITGVFESKGILHVCSVKKKVNDIRYLQNRRTSPYKVIRTKVLNDAVKFHKNVYVDFAVPYVIDDKIKDEDLKLQETDLKLN